MPTVNVNQAEIKKFSALASSWWDPQGELKSLHDINPLRLEWIRNQVGDLQGLKILDIGCGGGLLSESMAAEQAQVTGIDLAEESLQIAKLHSLETGIQVNYEYASAEDYADAHTESFDVVCCMELLEHVPDPESVIKAAAKLAKPGGTVLFSTLNRNLKSFALAIVAAEYLLGIVPKGTHDYESFIKPSEMGNMVRNSGLNVKTIGGIKYQPITRTYCLTDNADINYMLAAVKPI